MWVIDAKRYKGKVAVSKPLFGQPKLRIAGRDKTKLVDGLAKQVALVEAAMLEIAPDVPNHGADADLPMLGKLTFKGFPLLYPKSLAKRINAAGPLDRDRVPAVAAELAIRFPIA